MSVEFNTDNSSLPGLQTKPEIKALCIAAEGLCFGEGAISYAARAEHEVTGEELREVEGLFGADKVLTPIDTNKAGESIDDDGCGDGRGITDQDGNIVEVKLGNQRLERSLNRSKVFGGGATMAVSAQIALGRADTPLQEQFLEAISDLDDAKIDFGAHSDDHAHGEKSGCGAIDNAPKIIENIVKYRGDIYATIMSLDPDIDETVLDAVLDNFAAYDESTDQTGYSGKGVLESIRQDEKVVKQLVSGHQEMFVVLNEVAGYTVDQRAVREASKEKVQVFAVDMWRLQDIADRLYGDEDDDVKQRALLGELVYTLATAATLTDGSLPVYQIKSSKQTVNV